MVPSGDFGMFRAFIKDGDEEDDVTTFLAPPTSSFLSEVCVVLVVLVVEEDADEDEGEPNTNADKRMDPRTFLSKGRLEEESLR